jgi:DNA replicative helicase MCM subunit Mcm2 (Cdc46/Mcm family)
MFDVKLPEDREWIYAFLVEENRFGELQRRDNRNKESILRLSLAIARLRLEPEVKKEHMKKAIELLGE